MRYSHIIIHYDEITLKGKNRPFFERILMNNVKEMLKGEAIGKIGKEGGRIIIKTDDGTNIGRIRKILERLPGISNFSFVEEAEMDIDSIFKKAVQVMKEDKLEERYKTFKVIARRTNKDFKLNSPQINSAVGEYILANTSLRVDVHAPDIELNINIGDKKAFIYFEKVAGIGGLPVGSSGKAVCLLSGGIDSPVAAYMMMKRGMRITFVHFKNRSVMGSGEGVDKIKELVGILGGFQGKSKLYIVPFDDFQKEIIANIASKNRMIVYRRIMLRMAGLIAKKEGAGAVVVGDSIGQVASQTIENLSVAYKVIDMPILAPLIGFNKREIIDIASRIGTYDISIIPYQDCCSLMAAKHPETKADPGEIEKQEKNIDMIKIAQDCLSKIEPEII
ncbi:MAG: tRNA uracil 4-sulfurtransferase ThiI [Candidatus Paceibacterota bacterium]